MYKFTESMSKSEVDHCNLINHIEEAFMKIMRLEATKASFTCDNYTITAYDMKNQVIRIDIKVG